jgi:class 3 adenylate cyclase
MSAVQDRVAQLEAGIAAQERLRPMLGDAVVDTTVAALREQLADLRRTGRGNGAESPLARLQSYLPEELAAKARQVPHVAGERKQVTLLFADLAGFTELSEIADPEDIRDFQSDLFKELARIIYQHEGFVEKFVGDAVLAVFGAPVTHEDDPERALRAALAMRERMAVINRRWSERFSHGAVAEPLTLHVGVNTGPVIAGTLGSDLEPGLNAYAVTGDTVNAAARLQDAAQPGQILVSRTTFRQAQGAFVFQALEPIPVRGKREALAAYELLRARLLPGKVRGIEELGTAFVGREGALAQLQTVTQSIAPEGGEASDRPRIVVITGEAGIGKSRLAGEWHASMGDRVDWQEGRCFAHTTALPYGPFLDMLRRFANIVDDDTERTARTRLNKAIERIFPDDADAIAIAARLLGMRPTRADAARLKSLSPREFRERIASLAEDLFTRLASARPLVLFLEDMQWSDASSIELLERLLPLIERVNLAIVLAARTDDEPLAPLIATIQQKLPNQLLRMSLTRLPEVESGQMVRDLLSEGEVPAELITEVSNRADGNPFFVEEIIRMLIDRGALKREGGAWVTESLGSISVPETLQGLIMARIDRLPDETKQVVQSASAIGRIFLYRVLLAMAENTESLDADLTQLQRRELILEHARDPEVAFTFKHALTQEVAYDSLLARRRIELHRRVGEAMEQIFADRLGEFYAIVADHFSRGEVWSKAADYHLKAADHASQLFTPEAGGEYLRGLEALSRLRATQEVKRRRIDATIDLAREALFGWGDPADPGLANHLERLDTARSLAESLVPSGRRATPEDRLRLGRIHGWTAQVYSVRNESQQVETHVQQALALNNEIPDPEVGGRIGQVLVHRGRFPAAAAVLAPAVGPLEARGRWVDWVFANGTLAVAQAAQGDYRAAKQRAERGVARARNLHGLAISLAATNLLEFVLLMGGEQERAAELHRANAANAEQLGNAGALSVVQTLSCWHDAHEGDAATIDRVLGEEPRHGRRQPQLIYENWHNAFHAQMRVRRYHLARTTQAATPHAMAADRTHRQALAAARSEVDQVQRSSHEEDNPFAEGIALRVLAQTVAAIDPSSPDVDDYMSRSLAMLEAGGCVVESARTRRAWGQIGLERGDDAAVQRLEDAAGVFETAGLHWEADTTRALVPH